MSRVGKKPIVIPQGVEVTVDGHTVSVKGPKGQLKEDINAVVSAVLVDGETEKQIQISVNNGEDQNERAQWGTARALIANMVIGVTKGFEKKLEVNGVGYRVNMQGRTLVLNLGFSHEIRVNLPEGIDVAVEGNNITITGANKHSVGTFADDIRKLRKPEPYKGKGIKYADEVIRRKAGKAQKAGE